MSSFHGNLNKMALFTAFVLCVIIFFYRTFFEIATANIYLNGVIIGTTLFTLFLDVKSDVKLKVVIVISQVFWLIYDYVIMNFASLTFDVLTIISTMVGIVMILRGKEKEEIVVA
jgi:hypothetical protein